MPPDQQCQVEAHEIHDDKGIDRTPVVAHSFEHHTGGSTIRLDSTPILSKNTMEVASHFSSPSITRGLAAQRLFRTLLQTSMLSLRFEPCPYGKAVNVTNHYTRWAATAL
ncbi:hypothetical protein TNCV_1919301 [Trichonephila clavipes]|nr:hypothetical protein TNCV_1919301 [Trichonephila clavipes]